MFKREKDALSTVAKGLSTVEAVRRIIAYGSRVRGDFHEGSDLDVLVIVKEKTPELKDRIIGAFYASEMDYGVSFSVSILSEEELKVNVSMGSPFIRAVLEEGVLIYDFEGRRKEVAVGLQA